MSIFRRVILPVVWLLVGVAVALSLVKLAFFGNNVEATDRLEPSASPGYATVTVERGDIEATNEFTGVIQRDAGSSIQATQSGVINYVWVKNGDTVEKGERLFQIKVAQEALVENPAPATVGPSGGEESGEGEAAPEPQLTSETVYRYYDVTAPADGTLATFTAAVDKEVAKGDALGEVTSGRFSAIADLSPEQQYRLLDKKLDAKVTTPGVEGAFACAGLTVGEKEKEDVGSPTETVDPMTGEVMMQDAALAQIVCPLPEGTKTVPGLSAKISLDTGSVKGALVVPTTAVLGSLDSGTVFVIDTETGTEQETQVGLGLQGNGLVEITSGLQEGQVILKYAPGVAGDENALYEEGGW